MPPPPSETRSGARVEITLTTPRLFAGPGRCVCAERRSGSEEAMQESEDTLARREAEAAAAEAARIGGPAPDVDDEANRAVTEGGGGEAEGFEEAERELIEQATHGEDRWSPEVDAFTPEEEADRSSAVYGEPDEVDPTEVVSDPREDDDDPGEGPGVAAER